MLNTLVPHMYFWQDLRKCGATLAQILAAGQWKSQAFLRYLDEVGLLGACWCPGLRSILMQAELDKDAAFAVATESD